MLGDDLEGWTGEWGDGIQARRLKNKQTPVCMWLIRVAVQQKLLQCCKAVILQYFFLMKLDWWLPKTFTKPMYTVAFQPQG